jgi:hypothetical protein
MVSQGYVGSYGTFCTFALLDPALRCSPVHSFATSSDHHKGPLSQFYVPLLPRPLSSNLLFLDLELAGSKMNEALVDLKRILLR